MRKITIILWFIPKNYMLDFTLGRNYNNYTNHSTLQETKYMEKHLRTKRLKLVPIGNSKGIRIPKELLQKYGMTDSLLLEETDQGLLLRKKNDDKLSWEATYKAMAAEKENWDEFDAALLDGLEDEDFDY